MKIAIKTTRGRDVNGNTTYTAFIDGNRKKQQKVLSLSDFENHEQIAKLLMEKRNISAPITGAKYDDKTWFFITDEIKEPFYQSIKIHDVELIIVQEEIDGCFYFHIKKDDRIYITSNSFSNLFAARQAGYDYVKKSFGNND